MNRVPVEIGKIVRIRLGERQTACRTVVVRTVLPRRIGILVMLDLGDACALRSLGMGEPDNEGA
jgi:hypothetical protein